MEDYRLLTLEEVARRLNVSGKTVLRLVRSEQLPGRKVGGRWRFDLEAVEDWLRGAAEEPEEGKTSPGINREMAT